MAFVNLENSCWKKPPPPPTPSFSNPQGELQFMVNQMIMVEGEEKMDKANLGCLYLIEDKGMIWRNFTTKMEKYISFGTMMYFRMNNLEERPELGHFLEVAINGPVVTTFHNESTLTAAGVVAHSQFDDDVKSKSKPIAEDGDGSFGDTGTFEDAATEKSIKIAKISTTGFIPTSISVKFLPENQRELKELLWYIKQCWIRWCKLETDIWPSYAELHPPGQFADAETPPMSAQEKEETQSYYEALRKECGSPCEPTVTVTSNRYIFARGTTQDLDYPRRFKGFRQLPMRERFDINLEKFNKTVAKIPDYWMGHRPKKEDAHTMRQEIFKGRYKDSPTDQTMICYRMCADGKTVHGPEWF